MNKQKTVRIIVFAAALLAGAACAAAAGYFSADDLFNARAFNEVYMQEDAVVDNLPDIYLPEEKFEPKMFENIPERHREELFS